MKKVWKSILSLCLVLSFAAIPAASVSMGEIKPEKGEFVTATFEEVGSCEMVMEGEVQPRLVQTFTFEIPGDFQMYTVTTDNFLNKGDEVTVRGAWGHPYGIQVRLLQEDGGRALTVNLGVDDSYTFTVPVTGTYSLQVASHYDVSGTLIVSW